MQQRSVKGKAKSQSRANDGAGIMSMDRSRQEVGRNTWLVSVGGSRYVTQTLLVFCLCVCVMNRRITPRKTCWGSSHRVSTQC